MKVEEFIDLVSTELEQTVSHNVHIAPTGALEQAAKPGSTKISDIVSPSRFRAGKRDVRYRHILCPPASQEALQAWQVRSPSHPLPADLQALVTRINGIHLWANAETGRSYTGLAPIEEWELARIKMYGPLVDRGLIEDRYVALSYHQDGAAYIVLDTMSGKYYLMDTAGPDDTSPIANDVEGLLGWLWKTRFIPKP